MQCLYGFGDVMDAQNLRALFRPLERERNRTAKPLLDRGFVRERADQPLAACAEQDWHAKAVKKRQAAEAESMPILAPALNE